MFVIEIFVLKRLYSILKKKTCSKQETLAGISFTPKFSLNFKENFLDLFTVLSSLFTFLSLRRPFIYFTTKKLVDTFVEYVSDRYYN